MGNFGVLNNCAPSLLIKLMDMLQSPVEVGAGDDGSEERNDCGSLLHPVLLGLVGDNWFRISQDSTSFVGLHCIGVGVIYLTASKSETLYSDPIPRMLRFWFTDSWVDPPGEGYLGGEDAGVRNRGTLVIISRKASNWRRDNALWRVSSGLIGGTPPKPSIAATAEACGGTMSLRLGALDEPLITAVLNRLFADPVSFLLML